MRKKRRRYKRSSARRRQYWSEKFSVDFDLDPETKKAILAIFLFAVSAVSFLSFLDLAGDAGNFISDVLKTFFGWAYFLVPVILLILGYLIINYEKYQLTFLNYLGVILFVLSLTGLFHLKFNPDQAVYIINDGQGGGYLGLLVSYPLRSLMGFWASFIILLAGLAVSILLMFNNPVAWIKARLESVVFGLSRVKNFTFRKNYSDEDFEEGADQDADEVIEAEFDTKKIADDAPAGRPLKKAAESLEIIPTVRISRQVEIPLDLLNNKISKPTSGDINRNSSIIQKTLENFNIPVEMGAVSVGPTVTQFTLKPAEGIKLNKITGLNNDLALALAAHPIRIEAPIPGKSLIGIEVPNKGVAVVNLRELLETKNFKKRRSNLTLTIGKDVSGQAWLTPLEKMPHLLVAGATGSGKSVCLNSLIISLLYQNNPDILKFVMIDPKRVELTVYNDIPYLLTPVVTDVKKTVNALKWLIGEMDRRYDKLSKLGKRNIAVYNQTVAEKMPYIVVVIDELADLMVSAGNEVESSIVRLAQMARAVGIHLVLATQRPSVDIITGLIKANITSRIAFSVPSLMDSRTILDASGAEKLVGRGDLLFTSADLSKPVRLQGAYVSDDETRAIVDHIKNNFDQPDFIEEVTDRQTSGTSFDLGGEDDDELLPEARETVVRAGKASASYLQRRLKIGYARAARILDLLEEQGVIGPADGAKPREILVTEIYEEDYHGDDQVMAEPEYEDSEEEFQKDETGQ
ncbi:MAG TPA: DNA translocase FtsK 4TM domain-containing protein [Patescibacteria group bacterium]